MAERYLDIQNHWLIGDGVRHSPSFHCDDRPRDESISLLVIHNISLPPEQFGTGDIEAFFTGKLDWTKHPFYKEIEGVRVSAHVLIERTGQVIQFVPFDKRAWHAGVSNFNGKDKCNDFSIGVELEGSDTQPYTDTQYSMLKDITKILMSNYYEIEPSQIVGHQDIAPGRKTDPGPFFNWERYREGIAN